MPQSAKFKLSRQFCFSKHPWGPWGRQSSGVICISKIYQLFCDSGTALAYFFTFKKMLPNVSFIRMVIKKVFFSVSIATISNFLQKCTLWRHNYGTSQPKIGQCERVLVLTKVAHNWHKPFFSQPSPADSPELIFHIINMSQDPSVSLSVANFWMPFHKRFRPFVWFYIPHSCCRRNP